MLMMQAPAYNNSGVLASLRLDHLKGNSGHPKRMRTETGMEMFTRHLAGGFLHVFIKGKGERRILQPYLVGSRF